MTIEIEAGASQHQLSMKLFVVHALFRRLALEQKAIPTDADSAQQRLFEKKPIRFPKRHHP
jgi:hypothetical protein